MTANTNQKLKINRSKGISLSSLTVELSPGGGHAVNPNETLADIEAQEIQEIPMSFVAPDPGQPRKHIDPERLAQLVQAIDEDGLQQPITVRRQGNGYLIISGETRYRAHQELQKEKILCIVKAINDPAVLLRLQLSENVHRTDLTPIETAAGIDRLAKLQGVTFKAAAAQLFLTRIQITEYESLIDVPEHIHDLQTSGVTKDRRTLYEASKLHKQNPELAEEVIQQLKDSASEGAPVPNVRATLQNALKQTKQKLETPSPQPESQQAPASQLEAATHIALSVIRSSVREEGANVRISLHMSDGSSQSFLMDERASKDLVESISLLYL
jgi:ParB family chromosome partitioning protein